MVIPSPTGTAADALRDILRKHGHDIPDRDAIVFTDRSRLTYRELVDRVEHAMARSPDGSVHRPSVITWDADDKDVVVGLVAALCSPRAVAIVAKPSSSARQEESHRRVPSDPGEGGGLPAQALLIATSGSTRNPRWVVDLHTRQIVVRPRRARLSSRLGWRPGQRQMMLSPLHHLIGVGFVLEGLADGNTLVSAPSSIDDVAAGLRAEQVEWLQATPFHLRRLDRLVAPDGHDLPDLRAVVHTSAPCPELVRRRWIRRLGAEAVHEVYGATEGIGVTVCRGDEWEERPGTVGRPFFCQVRILAPDGTTCPVGELGEVYMRSATSRIAPYAGGSTISHTSDGMVSLGDHGWLDGSGFLYLSERTGDRATIGGITVSVAEIEEALLGLTEIDDAGVIIVAEGGAEPYAVAVVVGSRDHAVIPRSVRERLRRTLRVEAVPRRVIGVASIPRTPSGGVDRALATEMLIADRAAEIELRGSTP